jgi:hypothetical protein
VEPAWLTIADSLTKLGQGRTVGPRGADRGAVITGGHGTAGYQLQAVET